MRALKIIENASVALVRRSSHAPESSLQFQVDRGADSDFSGKPAVRPPTPGHDGQCPGPTRRLLQKRCRFMLAW